MPSRAVLRKKARRDAKRRNETEKPCTSAPRKGEVLSRVIPAIRAKESTLTSSTKTVHRPATYEKRAREEAVSDLPRKQRHKLETERRLERAMGRLQDPAAAEQGAGTLRHDPRFAHGTFWRDRKERRARTVFLGGVPVQGYSEAQVEELVTSTLRNDAAARSYLAELDSDTSPLSDIDYLPVKHGSRVRNMYVTLATVGLAGCLATALDGREIGGRRLRCNFAADKNQRAEAIRRRG